MKVRKIKDFWSKSFYVLMIMYEGILITVIYDTRNYISMVIQEHGVGRCLWGKILDDEV